MNSDSLNMVSRLGEGHMPWTFFLSEPQLKTTVYDVNSFLPLDTHKPVHLRKIASWLVELSSTENVNKRQTQPAVPAEQLVLSSYLWNPVWWNNWMKFFEV